ncbi:4-hydroxy-3-methylbut-2-en-1-yl diphosphate synthase (flavodoxin) [Candidatus Xenohaliotis californiensis]|uniref:4-hydroxy-3-methylbut-2-en-1-yl diphosphate synthase (Flavodoxin) n=1 Tax=Candidatus Xenohaliotis californiensis TaxID=84677 RepID=A0ABP0ESM0_9RICK|nr:4-hydroxy-3-methylbut-2-en-1-yl diphosphate synthase (flavodoxin) [Candidatus Xenohaliotis californiensis]
MRARHTTHITNIGGITIGGALNIAIQSMTNSNTADIKSTVQQIIDLKNAGSKIVRITVNDDEAANAVPYIKQQLIEKGCNIPLVGCFHYNGHILLKKYPSCAMALDKYRINPGNVGFGNKKDVNFISIIETLLKQDAIGKTPFSNIYYNKALRIGANWGSIDTTLMNELIDKNNTSINPKSYNEIIKCALITSTIQSVKLAVKTGMTENQIVLSCKISNPIDVIDVYQKIAKKSNCALHIGLTEAGNDEHGALKTATAMSVLLYNGYGDTIRASTTNINKPRSYEVKICQQILQAMGLQSFSPAITSCPGCGRTNNQYFKQLVQGIQQYIEKNHQYWLSLYSKTNELKIAIMGCIVNGPGESKHADIGLSLPGNAEHPSAVVYINGQKHCTLHNEGCILSEFKKIINNYIKNKQDITQCSD